MMNIVKNTFSEDSLNFRHLNASKKCHLRPKNWVRNEVAPSDSLSSARLAPLLTNDRTMASMLDPPGDFCWVPPYSENDGA